MTDPLSITASIVSITTAAIETKLFLQRSKHAAEDELLKVCQDEKQQPNTYGCVVGMFPQVELLSFPRECLPGHVDLHLDPYRVTRRVQSFADSQISIYPPDLIVSTLHDLVLTFRSPSMYLL